MNTHTVYSFGMMCYELITFTTPFENIQNESEYVNMVTSGEPLPFSKDKRKLYQPLIALHHSCVCLLPSSRPTWSEVILMLEGIKNPSFS